MLDLGEMLQNLQMSEAEVRQVLNDLLLKRARKANGQKRPSTSTKPAFRERSPKAIPLMRAGWCNMRAHTRTLTVWCTDCEKSRVLELTFDDPLGAHRCIFCGGKLLTSKPKPRVSVVRGSKKKPKSKMSALLRYLETHTMDDLVAIIQSSLQKKGT